MRMHFRIKHFDRYVGIFVILALVFVFVTLVFTARGQRWFEKRYHYTVLFQKVHGLKAGTAVTISGMEVGAVKSLRINPENKVELTLEVLRTYKDYIRKDSQATIVSGLLGGKTVEVTVGSPNEPLLAEGVPIASREPKELTDILKEIDVKAPLEKLDEALENIKSITEKLSSPRGELFTLLKNMEILTTQLKEGRGNVGAILQDRKMHREINAAVESLRRSASHIEETTQNASKFSRDLPRLMVEVDRAMQEVPRIVEDVKKAAADLSLAMGEVQKAASDGPAIAENVKDITQDVKVITGHVKKSSPEIPGLLATTQESVEEAEKLIQGLQNHWLLRGSMEQTRGGSPVEISQRETPYGPKGGDSR